MKNLFRCVLFSLFVFTLGCSSTLNNEIMLTHTQEALNKCVHDKVLDTYALLIYYKGRQGGLISQNANRDTLFDIASIGKVVVTSTLILHALDEGKLSLDDTLPKFFDNVPEDKKEITLRHLLTHTSGILRKYTKKEFYSEIHKGNDAIANFILSQPLGFTPGTRTEYSCFGYIMLGFVAEKVYGMSLDKAYDEKIQKPLGDKIVVFNPSVTTHNMALTHYREKIGDCASADDIAYEMKGVCGHGCSFASLSSLQKFVECIMNKDERLYSKKTFDIAEKNYTPNFKDKRGLGWMCVSSEEMQVGGLFTEKSLGHTGNTGGSIFFDREKDLYVILLTNATRFGYVRTNYDRAEYEVTKKMRKDVHTAIKKDLGL